MPTWKAVLFLLCVETIGAQTVSAPSSPPTAEQIVSFVDARRQLSTALESALVGKNATASYRVVPVIGPAYGIGAAIDPLNPLDLETRRCVVVPKQLPSPDPWIAFPRWNTSDAIGLGAGLPTKILKALLSVNLQIGHDQSASYEFADVSQQLIAKSDFLSLIATPGCLKQLKAHPGGLLLVRGVILGRETLKSGGEWLVSGEASATLLTKDMGGFKIKYDHSGRFELQDSQAVAKFLVLTMVKPPDRGTIEHSLRRPSDADIELLLQMESR